MKKFLLLLLIPFLFGFQNFHRALEPETVAYYTLGNSDGTSQFTLNEQMKSLKYNGGIVTLSGLTCNLSLVNGTAFITNPSVDLRKYVGSKISITETTDTLVGWIAAAGTGESLDVELLTGFTNSSVDILEVFNVSGTNIIEIGNSAGYGKLYSNAFSITNNALYKTSINLTLNSGVWPSRFRFATDFNLNTITYDYITNTNGAQSYYRTLPNSINYWGIRWEGSYYGDISSSVNSIKKVLTPSSTGVTIVSAQGGSTYNWTSGTATIIPNAASFTSVISAK